MLGTISKPNIFCRIGYNIPVCANLRDFSQSNGGYLHDVNSSKY